MKAVIVEDEKPAIENLKYFLKEYPIEIAGIARNLIEAVSEIEEKKPDIVFLDINLSGENGFELFDKIEINFKTIFVTAYDSFALRAFEVNALDYLLKPLIQERVAIAMSRLLSVEMKTPSAGSYTIEDSIFLANGMKACFINLRDILYIESESCYSKVVCKQKAPKVILRTLKKWEAILPTNAFIRVHRAFIVNVNQIKELIKRQNGTYAIMFNDQVDTIEVSRRYAQKLKKYHPFSKNRVE